MKKLSTILIVLALLILIPAGTVLGKTTSKIKGEIIGLDTSSMQLETKDGNVNVLFPEGVETDGLALGLVVMVDGNWDDEGNFVAAAVKVVDDQDEVEDEDAEDADIDDEEGEEGEENTQNAFCTGEKDSPHPLAAKIVERFGEEISLTEDQVMTWFCEGNSFGQIMLALVTQKFDGSKPEDILEMRKNGMGWGNIWKEKGLIGNARLGTPPGQIIKPDKADKGTPPGLENKPDKDNKIPPGQLKKTPPP